MSVESKKNWSYEETAYFIELVEEHNIMNRLDGKRFRNAEIYRSLVKPMCAAGYNRNLEQLRIKWKHLQTTYRNAKSPNTNRKTCPHYTALHKILGGRPNPTMLKKGPRPRPSSSSAQCEETGFVTTKIEVSPRVGGVKQDDKDEPASGTDSLIVPQTDGREYIIMEDGTSMPIDAEDWPSPAQEKCIATFLSPPSSINSDRPRSKPPPQRPITLKRYGSLAEVKLEMLKEDAEQKKRRDDEEYRSKKRAEREEAEVRLQILKTELLIKKEILKQEIERTNSMKKSDHSYSDDTA